MQAASGVPSIPIIARASCRLFRQALHVPRCRTSDCGCSQRNDFGACRRHVRQGPRCARRSEILAWFKIGGLTVRIFQTNRYYPALRPRLRELDRHRPTFKGMIDAFLDFRECAAHILEPVYARAETAFYTNPGDEFVQRQWAKEQGMNPRASLGAILKAQIEAHRTEVFYVLDATSLDREFMSTLPGCVKKTIAWHAIPFKNIDLSVYDLVVCNFPSILAELRTLGCRTEYFTPAHDPELAPFAARQDRPIDVLFVGGYSRHHERR